MLKTLLKKQLLETLNFFFIRGKKGARRSPVAIVGIILLVVYALAAAVIGIWALSNALIPVFLANNLAWAYFALFGAFATSIACVGSVFAVINRIYEAKDNDLLLSMPIKPWKILFSRVFSLYLLSLVIVAIVFLPAAVRYFVATGFEIVPAACLLLITLLLPLGALAVCCLLGWLIAVIGTKLPAKNFFTVILLLAFFAFYFYMYSQMNAGIEYVLLYSEQVGETLQKIYPFWQMGLAATGNVLALAIFSVMFIAAFALVYLLLSKTFLWLVTAKRGERKRKYVEKERKSQTPLLALLKKESARYLKKPLVTLNCILGTVLFVAFPIVALFNKELVSQIALIPDKGEIAVILTVLLCFISSSNIITSSSVSLEGEILWILKSLPVSSWKILSVKTVFHLLITGIPAIFSATFLCVLLKINVTLSLLCMATVCVLTVLCAVLGLFINLKLPNLHWTNEVVAVKQSLSSLLGMFAGWGISALLVGGYFLLGKYLPAWGYLGICIALLSVGAIVCGVWLKKRGTQIFEEL